jgi:riboflavin synthase alpha subunit
VINLEADILGKYVESYLQQRNIAAPADSHLTVARLQEEGF